MVKSLKADLSNITLRANAQNVSTETLYGGKFTFSTHLLTLNYLLYSPTSAAPQFLQKLTPSIYM